MVKLVTGASVEILEKDSENIFQIIQSRYKGLTSSIKVLKIITSHLGQVIVGIEIKQYYNISQKCSFPPSRGHIWKEILKDNFFSCKSRFEAF